LAFEHYLRGVLYGDQQSVLEVGRCYYFGIGVKKDRKSSNIWLERAETLGFLKPHKKPSKSISKRGKVRNEKNEKEGKK